VHEREPDFITDRVVAPDFVNANLVVLAQPSRDVDHPCRHIQMKRRPQLRKMRPLGERLEMIDRFTRLDLDHPLQTVPALLREQDQVWIDRRVAAADGRVLLRAGVHARLELPAPLVLQESDNAVVLELFADRPHQNRAHERLQRDECGG